MGKKSIDETSSCRKKFETSHQRGQGHKNHISSHLAYNLEILTMNNHPHSHSENTLNPAKPPLKFVRTLQYSDTEYHELAEYFNTLNDSGSWPGGFNDGIAHTAEMMKTSYHPRNHAHLFVTPEKEGAKRLVGCCFLAQMENLENGWYVEFLSVDPAFQGKKYGKSLLLAATSLAFEKGAQILSLHTWAGNMKAMPLYKRQGYKWRPGTNVYMENYIPQILQFPATRPFFEKHDWYASFKPHITQEIDDEREEEWQIYEYHFKTGEDTLTYWIDRTVGRISGFEWHTPEFQWKIKFSISQSRDFIHWGKFHGSCEMHAEGILPVPQSSPISIQVKQTPHITLTHPFIVEYPVSQKGPKQFPFEGMIDANTSPLDIETHPITYSVVMMEFECLIANQTVCFALGKIPLDPVSLRLLPEVPHFTPGQKGILQFAISNHITSESRLFIRISDGQFIRQIEPKILPFQSEYEQQYQIPVTVLSTPTTVDQVKIEILDASKSPVRTQSFALPVIEVNKNVRFSNLGKEYIENQYTRIAYYPEARHEANIIDILDRSSNILLRGFPLILGNPIDENEFGIIPLTHHVLHDHAKGEVALQSRGMSRNHPGVTLTREITLQKDHNYIDFRWIVRNTNTTSINDISVHHLFPWHIDDLKYSVIPTKEKLIDTKNSACKLIIIGSPSQMKEGWMAAFTDRGFIGTIFNHEDPYLEEIEYERQFPFLKYHIPEIAPNTEVKFGTIRYYIAPKWQKIQQNWAELWKPEYLRAGNKGKLATLVKSHVEFGISKSTKADSVQNALIYDVGSPKPLYFRIQAVREINFAGSIEITPIVLASTATTSVTIPIPQFSGKAWHCDFPFPEIYQNTVDPLCCFQVKLHTDTLVLQKHITLLNYNSSLSTSNIPHDTFQEIQNGPMVFQASEQFKGSLIRLQWNHETENLIESNFPEPKPFLWWNKGYNGMEMTLFPGSKWNDAPFNALSWTFRQIDHPVWDGLEYISEKMHTPLSLTGIQVKIQYLTKPGANFLLVRYFIINNAHAPRKIKILARMVFPPVTTACKYFIPTFDKRIAEFKCKDASTPSYRAIERKNQWIAHRTFPENPLIASVLLRSIPDSLNVSNGIELENLSAIMHTIAMMDEKIEGDSTIELKWVVFPTNALQVIPPVQDLVFTDLPDTH